SNEKLLAISIIDKQIVFVSGTSGIILSTENGGETWEHLSTPTEVALSDLSFSNSQKGVVVGYGTILFTTNAGKAWQKIESRERLHLASVELIGDYGWISTGTALIPIKNEQVSLNSVKIIPEQGQITGLFFLNKDLGWVVKSRGTE